MDRSRRASIIARRLRDARDESGLVQREVAAHLEVATSHISMWETGKITPSAVYIAELAEVLGCTADYLLGVSE